MHFDNSIRINPERKIALEVDETTVNFSHKIINFIGGITDDEPASCTREWLVNNKPPLHLGNTECIFWIKRK